jgi:hypothetical protein
MSSAEANVLAERIREEQSRWRIVAIRLVGHKSCSLALRDSRTDREVDVLSREEWLRLRSEHEAGS